MRMVRCWEPLGQGPHHEAANREIIEGWPPDEAGEVLGPLVERCPTMRLHKRKHLKRWATR